MLVILIVFIVLAGIATAGGTIFRVRNIEIYLENPFQSLVPVEAQVMSTIRNAASVTRGRNILFGIDRDRIINAVEDAVLRVDVRDVIPVFPNTVRIVIRERFAVFQYEDTQSDRTFVMDSQLRFISEIPVLPLNTIDISGVLPPTFTGNLGPGDIPFQFPRDNLDSLELGDYFINAFTPQEDEEDTIENQRARLFIERLRNIANRFSAYGNHEDSLTHLFYSVLFFEAAASRLDVYMILRNHYTAAASPSRLEIIGITVETEFLKMLNEIWTVRNEQGQAQAVYNIRLHPNPGPGKTFLVSVDRLI